MIVRAVPNLPGSIRRGVVAVQRRRQPKERTNCPCCCGARLRALGTDRGRLAAIGSIAGAGPAYVARFIDDRRRAPTAVSMRAMRER
jgi:pyrroline-5-carboxylate reductase